MYLDRLRVYPIKQIASSEGWKAGDLTRVLIVLGPRETFQDTEHLAKRLRHAGFVNHMLRPLKAEVANSEVMDLRLLEGFAAIVEISQDLESSVEDNAFLQR